MNETRSRFFFDAEDYEIVEVIERVLEGRKRRDLRKLFDPYLHPRGIKEMAAPKALRTASALADLLESLEGGQAEDRLRALRAAHAEVMHNNSPTLRKNTARVLLQLIKELIRAHGDRPRQLRLAHEFRTAVAGRPRQIRRLLHRYHLLEMPEWWNQLTFDHHVHDISTGGRKSPTHLIMDAWIKGIRELVVVHENYPRKKAASELHEAAEIMGVRLRVGIRLSALLRGRHVKLIWLPRGFHTWQEFISFLDAPEMQELISAGRALSALFRRRLRALFTSFVDHHLPSLVRRLELEPGELSWEAFEAFMGTGQPSDLHLAEYIHHVLRPVLQRRARELAEEYERATAARRAEIAAVAHELENLVPEVIAESFLTAAKNPDVPPPHLLAEDGQVPELLSRSPREVLERIERVPCRSSIVLCSSGLTPEDALEVLYLGAGRITHLEIFNLKDFSEGKTKHLQTINRIRRVLNTASVVEGKRLVMEMIARIESDDGHSASSEQAERKAQLRQILHNIARFQGYYHERHHLESMIGSGSTGRSRRSFGMGLVVPSSLPRRARGVARASSRHQLPLRTAPEKTIRYTPREGDSPLGRGVYALLRRFGLPWGYDRHHEWQRGPNSTVLSAEDRNIVALGGTPEELGNGLPLPGETLDDARERERERGEVRRGRRMLNSRLTHVLKVLLGFVPAFLTFYLTKQWWLLAYFGAVIWFSITGARNILQSVIGGGGLRRSSLLDWKDLVSWGRVAESLLYTGFSVPLLDYLVKTVLLDRGFGVNTSTSPVALYTVIALANGIYISSHNAIRGLQPAAIFGNFFRTVLSIPLAVGLNAGLFAALTSSGMPETQATADLQLWAAVISKLCSDFVAAVIEGTADRATNFRLRQRDFDDKLAQVFSVHERLELLFAEEQGAVLLDKPKKLVKELSERAPALLQHMIVNALDLLYFWSYQPRARVIFRRALRCASPDERAVLLASQRILERKVTISELFVGGFVGKRFDMALAFYLSRRQRYLEALAALDATLRKSS